MRRMLFGLLLAATMIGLADPGYGNATDDRVARLRETGTPLGAIGMVLRLDADGSEAGTGFLVSACHVLTAGHVVAGASGISTDQVMLFFAGTGNLGPSDLKADYFGTLSPARPVVWGDYRDVSQGSTEERIAAFHSNSWGDWALLKLDRCLDDEFKPLGLLPISTRDFMRAGGVRAVTAVGLPADRPNDKLTVDPACSMLGQVSAAGWQHDCITMPGNSGGPVLAAKPEPGEKWPRVLAITVASVSAAESADGKMSPQLIDPEAPDYFDLLATAVPVSAFLPEIAAYLPADAKISAYLAREGKAKDTGYSADTPQPAIDDINQALSRHPRDPMLLMRRGQWHIAAEDEGAALGDFSAALQAAPDFAPALRGRALLRAARDDKKQGDLAAAKSDLDRLITRFPNLADLRVERGGLAASEFDYEAALPDFNAVLKREPSNMMALLSRANARMELGDAKGAGADYDAAIAAEPDLGFLYVQRAHYHARVGNMKAAFADIDKALKIEPEMPSAISGRAVLYLHAGSAELALAEADKAVGLDPESGPTVALRGSIRQVLGNLDGAIADFRKAGELDPREPFDPLLLFLALAEAGRPEEGKVELEKLLARWPETEWPSPLAQHLLGRLPADKLEARVKEGNPTLRTYQSFDRHFYLGMSAFIAGDKKAAREHLQAAVALDLSQFLEFDIARAYLQRLGGPAFLDPAN